VLRRLSADCRFDTAHGQDASRDPGRPHEDDQAAWGAQIQGADNHEPVEQGDQREAHTSMYRGRQPLPWVHSRIQARAPRHSM
jgi:hypothetical protein